MDLKYALRQLSKSPGFALVAIVTLALGVGANTAIFSYVNAWIIRPLPFPEPNQLVVLFETDKRTGGAAAVAPADWRDWRDKAGIFKDLAAMDWASYNLTGHEEPEKLAGAFVTANFFRVLGVKPALGREVTDAEETPGSNHVVILTHELWRDRFASDRGILGRKITLDGAATTVIGVLPENFEYIPMGRADLFTPLALTPQKAAARDSRMLQSLGRLNPGLDAAGAGAALAAFQASLERAYPGTNANRGVLVRSLREEIGRQAGSEPVKILFYIVCFVLLIACANVANLMMARATGRRKEMAVRLAIGAGRGRVVRQLLVETIILFGAGAAGGLLVAHWGIVWIDQAIPLRSRPYLPNFGHVNVDEQMLLFALAVALATGLVFGLAPALESTRFDLNSMLKDSAGRGTGSLSGARFRKGLVAGGVALALVVVVCGALLINSFTRMMRVDPGFRGDRVLVAEMQLPPKYDTSAGIAQFYDRVLERLASMPGVERAAAAGYTPFSEGGNIRYLMVEGRPEPPSGQLPWVRVNVVTPGYLESMSIPLVAGRALAREDSAGATPAIVINETIVQREFTGENPIGKRVRLSRRGTANWFTVVGVVKSVKYYTLAAPPENQAYIAFAQSPLAAMSVVARMSGDAASAAQSIRSVVRSVDPNQPVSRIITIAEQIEERNAPTKILSQLMGFFGALALFLAAIGIYGVMAYSVSQRTQEIGVRMALGAAGRDVFGLIVRQGMTLVLGGLVAGVAGALGMARLLTNLLFGVESTDPVTFAATIFLMTAVALLACWIPARRATKVDPLVTLRYE